MRQSIPHKVAAYAICICISIVSSAHLYGQIIINEYSASNLGSFADNYGDYEDWIELHNPTGASVSVSGFHLSDNVTNPFKWVIPPGAMIPAGGYLVIWASGRDEVTGSNYHANFKLQQTKTPAESVILSSPLGTVLDQHTLEITKLAHSRGRSTDVAM